MIYGKTATPTPDLALLDRRTVLFDSGGARPVAGSRLGSVIVWMDGLAGGSTEQPVRAVARTAAGGVVAGPPVVIAAGTAAAWVHLLLPDPPEADLLSATLAGLWAGSGGTVRVGTLSGSGSLQTGSTDDPAVLPTTMAAVASRTLAAAVYYEPPYVVPTLTDATIATALPLPVAQATFEAMSAPSGTFIEANAAWHGPSTDERRGAIAFVRIGGPLESYVGERLRLTSRDSGRSVIVYVLEAQAFGEGLDDEDISVPRNAYLPLGPLWADHAPVTAEVLL
jgi:hypothetical protein